MVSVGFPQKSTFATLRATKIICNDYDALDAAVNFQRDGVLFLHLTGSTIVIDKNLALNTNLELQDISGNALIAGDNVGNIDQLAPIADNLLTPAEKFKQTIDFVSTNLSGGAINTGPPLCWTSIVGESIKGYISGPMLFNRFGGKTKLTKMTLWFGTNVVGTYITSVYLYRLSKTGAVDVAVISSTTDLGNGTTGDDSASYVIAENLEEGYNYWYDINTIVPSGFVFLYCLTFEGELVIP